MAVFASVSLRRVAAACALAAAAVMTAWWWARRGPERVAPPPHPEAAGPRDPDGAPAGRASALRDETPEEALRRILEGRARALLELDDALLADHYDLRSRPGQWALEHEQRRIRYLGAWSDRRGVRLVSARSDVRVTRAEVRAGEAWLSAVQSTRLGYVYRDDATLEKHLFGIGTRHAIQMVRRDGRWVIRRDWYTDPLDEDALIPEVTPADVAASGGLLEPLALLQARGTARCMPPGVDEPGQPLPALLAAAWWRLVGALAPGPRAAGREARYDGQQAAAYARQYCGGAWGCGNGGRYNPAYRDYTDVGGDCTNFASQALHAGGLPMDGTWYYRRGSGGSRAWVQTTGLLNYLLSRGLGRLLARGRYGDVARATERFPRGAIDALRPGDLIAYQEQGKVVHFAVVTGRDFRGYQVVNSHTADRNAVPWDVGWDQATVFWLIQVGD